MKKEKNNHYISGKESSRIAKENARAIKELNARNKAYTADDYVTEMKNPADIAEFEDLHTYFYTDRGVVKAVNGVTFEIPAGATVGIVGESGCGKSITSMSMMRLIQAPRGQIVSGSIRFRSNVRTHAVGPKMRPKKDENGQPVLDENGQPVLEQVLNKDGTPRMEKLYKPLLIEKKDENGNVVLDKDGQPVLEQAYTKPKKQKMQTVLVPLKTEKKDENGELVLDENGQPIYEQVLDENGAPKMKKEKIPVFEPKKDENGEPVLDEDGQPVLEPVWVTRGKPVKIKVYEEHEEVLDLAKLPPKEMAKIRGREIAMIFQEPMTSLNPVFTVGFQLDEVTLLHVNGATKQMAKERSIEMLSLVGIAMPEHVYKSYPHELSGGMRQRVMIAMALCCNPRLIIADEPTTALDVTIQAQILDLLREVKHKISGSIMFITHDLGVIAEMADYVVVMYAGRIVEKGTVQEIFDNPMHPYTVGLQRSKPVVGKNVERLYNIPGNVPNPINMPSTCYFRDRCGRRCAACAGDFPPMVQVSPTHFVACYRVGEQGDKGGEL